MSYRALSRLGFTLAGMHAALSVAATAFIYAH
jgi:hypothetical protein